MTPHRLDQLWEPSALSRIGGAAQGGSTKTPREREALNQEHEGRDAKETPQGALPPQKPAPQQEHPPQVHPEQVHPAQKHPPQK